MSSIRYGLMLTALAGASLAAQAPGAPGQGRMQRQGMGQGMGPGMGMARPAPNAAQFFLANTARLQLNDQQVTRLAAIARRAEARNQQQRTAMDSMRSRMMSTMPADSAGRAARRQAMMGTMQSTMENMREQQHADLRDALAVLNADQQARAWEMRGAVGRDARARAGARRQLGAGLRRNNAPIGRGAPRGPRAQRPAGS